MTVADGKTLAANIIRRLQNYPRPHRELAVVMVGKNPTSSMVFIKQKQLVAKRLGVRFSILRYPSNISQKRLEAELAKLNRSKNISGIIVQLPLPPRISAQAVLDRISAEKDVDVLSSAAFGKFATGCSDVLPPVAAAIAEIAQRQRILVKGARAAVIGSGKLVGLPTAIWLAKQGATVLLVNELTRNISRFTKDADIVVCGAGKPGLVKGSMIKRGAAVFDAGYGMKNGKPSGDCEFESVAKKARFVTPVPGGIGPLTVAMLFKNFYNLSSASKKPSRS